MDAVVPAGHDLLLRVWQYRMDGTDPQGPTADVQARLPALPPAPGWPAPRPRCCWPAPVLASVSRPAIRT